MTVAPIIITVYNRLSHFKLAINSLKKNELAQKSELYVVSDAASCESDRKIVCQIRNYASSIEGFKKVYLLFWEHNLGSNASWQTAIKIVLESHNSFIGMEDDIIVAPSYLEFLNAGLQYYESDKRVFCICAFTVPFKLPLNYSEDIYFYNGLSPWGFAIWKDRYQAIDESFYDRYSELKKNKKMYKKFLSIGFYIKGILLADSKGEIEAGDMRWYYHMVKNDLCSVFPTVSKAQNWGFDGSGEHCGNRKVWWAKPKLDVCSRSVNFIPFQGYNKDLLKNHRKFQDKINGGLLAKWFKYTWFHELWIKMKK